MNFLGNGVDATTIQQLMTILAALLVVDSVYLCAIYGAFGEMIRRVQGSPMKFRLIGAVVCYAALTAVLYSFIVKPRRPATDAAILGASIYAVYESTNYATLKDWNGMIAVVDTIWGGALFYIVTSLVYYVNG